MENKLLMIKEKNMRELMGTGDILR